jgi:drug/metabolite transporter (DMT)-like permease
MNDFRNNGKGKILLALLSVYFIWGSTYLAIRLALEGFPPFMMAGIRFIVTGGGTYFFLRMKDNPVPTQHEWTGGLLVGGLLLLGGNGGVVYAEQWVSSGIAALGVAAVPLWTVLFSGIWKRWPNRLEWVGIAIGFAGVAFLNLESGMRASPAGAIALLWASVCWALGSAWSRHLSMPKGLMSVAVQMMSGGVLLLATSFLCGEQIEVLPGIKATGALLYLMLFGSLIAFSAYIYLLRKVRPALATSYAYVNPVVAVALGIVFAGEKITVIGVAAMVIISAGVILVALGQRRRHEH